MSTNLYNCFSPVVKHSNPTMEENRKWRKKADTDEYRRKAMLNSAKQYNYQNNESREALLAKQCLSDIESFYVLIENKDPALSVLILKNRDFQTIRALEIANKVQNLDVVKLLLKVGVGVEKNLWGKTIFHIVAENGDLCFFQNFSKDQHDFDLNIQDIYGRTPLHYAVISGLIKIYHCLMKDMPPKVKSKVRPVLMKNQNEREKHKAKIKEVQKKFIQLFLNYGAKVDIVDYYKKQPLEYLNEVYAGGSELKALLKPRKLLIISKIEKNNFLFNEV